MDTRTRETVEQLLAFARSKPAETYNSANIFVCAFAQFRGVGGDAHAAAAAAEELTLLGSEVEDIVIGVGQDDEITFGWLADQLEGVG